QVRFHHQPDHCQGARARRARGGPRTRRRGDRMKRREFITLLGGAVAWPIAARAQQPAMPVIGMLLPFAAGDPEAEGRVDAFKQKLQELGWSDGRNVRIDYRWIAGDNDRMQSYAKELLGLKPDVIVANSTLVLAALKNETKTVPIVFVSVPDPV